MDDQQLEMQKQRLFDNDGLEPAARQQPLALQARGKPKRSSLTPARFCIGLCSLLGLIFVGSICYGLFIFARDLGWPHEQSHADAKLISEPGRESELVRPVFGPPASGALLTTFDLGLLIHARWAVEVDSERVEAEKGGEGLLTQPFETGSWHEIHRAIVLKDVPLDTRPVHTTVPLRFPREIIRSLVNHTAEAEVIASFFMLPPSTWESPLLRSDEARPAKVVSASVRGDSTDVPPAERLPPVWSPTDDNDDDEQPSPFAQLLSRAVAYDNILHSRGRANATDPMSQTYDVRSRVWVTTPRDWSVYNATTFHEIMDGYKESLRGACKGGLDQDSVDCWRSFAVTGHFEHLLQVNGTTPADARQWYAPSFYADLGEASAKDYVPLPILHGNASEAAAVDDFLFDYRISFSTSSVRKLGILQHVHKPFRVERAKLKAPRLNMTAYDQAYDHDSAEFWNALRGHSFEPGTRPIVRGVLEFVSGVLNLVSPAVQLYFFLTRTLTTGISMPALVLDQATSFCSALVHVIRFWMFDAGPLVVIIPVFGFNLVLAVAVANLSLRLNWSWGGPFGWVPVGVFRRRPTHSERASARADAEFIWRDRIIIFAVCLVLFAYGPASPKIISASPPSQAVSPTSVGIRVTSSTSSIGRVLIPLIYPSQGAFWWSFMLAQLHLNWRRKSFGESKLYRTLCLTEAILDWIPIVFHASLGRAELMSSLTLRGIVKMAAQGAMVYQAWLYPSVPQEEAEDE